MKPFQARVLKFEKAYELPDSWRDDDYRALLERLEVEGVDDLSPADRLDFLLMALQDLEPDDAADAVLAQQLGKRITPGSRRNIVDDLLDGQRPWEEFADIALHARIFAAAELLHRALPGTFARPDLRRLTVELRPRTAEARQILRAPPEPAFVTRLLADAMDETSILERLFDRQLRARTFPEAEGIVWSARFDAAEGDGEAARLTVYSCLPWLEDMESIDEFESAAYNDREADDDDDVRPS